MIIHLQIIRYNQSQTVLFKLLSGLLGGQTKYLPIRYAPLTIELELVDNMTDPILRNNNIGPSTAPLTTVNTSIEWHIENVQLKCDLCTLDNALDNSYAQHLLSGKSLPINFNTYISQIQSMISSSNIGHKSIKLNVTRALSRLKSVFVTLIASFKASDPASVKNIALRDWNNFYSPMRDYSESVVNHFNSN